MRKKNKYTQDDIAMIIADWEHGEWTKCTCGCSECPLNKDIPISLTGLRKMTVCNILTEISVLLNEIE